VDGPKSFNGIERQMINFNDLQLTDFRLNIRLNARAKTIAKALTTAKDGETSVLDQWKASKWAQKIESREAKAAQTDLGRFRAMRKRQAVRYHASYDGPANAPVSFAGNLTVTDIPQSIPLMPPPQVSKAVRAALKA